MVPTVDSVDNDYGNNIGSVIQDEIGNDNKAAEKEEKWGHDDDNLAGKDGKGTCGDDRTREGGDKRVETSETIPENETVKQEPELIAYDPIIVAGYQDGHIRFWNLQV